MAEPYLICPQNWYTTTLEPDISSGYIVSVDTGSTPLTKVNEYWDGDYYWLTPKETTRLNQVGQLYVSKSERLITEKGLSSCSGKLFPPGTVMLTKRAPVGAVSINTVPMATNQGFLNFTCGEKLRPTYLAYWLLLNKPYLDKVANGSTYPEIYKADLFEFEISIPPLAEQDKIIKIAQSIQFLINISLPIEQASYTGLRLAKVNGYTERLLALRKKLLLLLFSGRIDIFNKDKITTEK